MVPLLDRTDEPGHYYRVPAIIKCLMETTSTG